MEYRIVLAGTPAFIFLYLFLLHLVSRRIAPAAGFGFSFLLWLAGAGAYAAAVLGENRPPEPGSLPGAALSVATAGFCGALLTSIDCFRREAWRAPTVHPVVHAVGPERVALLRGMAARVRAGERMQDCPFCHTRVLFGNPPSCPQCGRALPDP